MTGTAAAGGKHGAKGPFGLPNGSIRALLALGIFGAIWVVLAARPEEELPDYLRDLLFIILGHYFASRRKAEPGASPEPQPLYLPRGSIRLIVFGGFAAVATILFRRGRLLDPVHHPAVITLLLVAGFFLGVILSKFGEWWAARGHGVPRWIDNGRAVIGLGATAALIVLVMNHYFPFLDPATVSGFEARGMKFGNYGPEHLLAAVVGFYFGSRS